MLAFFDELDCFGGSRPNDWIPLLYLVDILAATSCFIPFISIWNRFPKDTIRPKLEFEHNCLQSSAKAQLSKYTTNPVPNRPIVQCQSPSVHFPRVPITTCRPRLHSSCCSWIAASATSRDSVQMRRLLQYFSIAVQTGLPVATFRFRISLQLGLSF